MREAETFLDGFVHGAADRRGDVHGLDPRPEHAREGAVDASLDGALEAVEDTHNRALLIPPVVALCATCGLCGAMRSLSQSNCRGWSWGCKCRDVRDRLLLGVICEMPVMSGNTRS